VSWQRREIGALNAGMVEVFSVLVFTLCWPFVEGAELAVYIVKRMLNALGWTLFGVRLFDLPAQENSTKVATPESAAVNRKHSLFELDPPIPYHSPAINPVAPRISSPRNYSSLARRLMQSRRQNGHITRQSGAALRSEVADFSARSAAPVGHSELTHLLA